MPYNILRALFAVLVSWAFETPSLGHLLWPMAVLLRVAYFGLLRVNEFLGLLRKDLSFPSNDYSGDSMVLALASPKTRRYMGRAQFSLIEDQCCSGYPWG